MTPSRGGEMRPSRPDQAAEGLRELLDIMARLRDPATGCPWDVAQTHRSIAPYTIEEAYEVADAIERDALDELVDELGDLQLQVVFHAQMASERNAFDFSDVVRAISRKMVRRHPHVFDAASPARTPAEQKAEWEAVKAEERAAKAGVSEPPGALDGVARGLPALVRAEKIQGRAARVGFDWPSVDGVRAKVHEELAELEAEINLEEPEELEGPDAPSPASSPAERQHEELGDLLFAAVNLARHLGLDADAALRGATHRFEQRFAVVEALARERGSAVDAIDIDALEALWQRAKESLRQASQASPAIPR